MSDTPFRSIFVSLNVVHIQQHLNLGTFYQLAYYGAEMLKNTFWNTTKLSTNCSSISPPLSSPRPRWFGIFVHPTTMESSSLPCGCNFQLFSILVLFSMNTISLIQPTCLNVLSPKAYSLAFPILGKHYPILFTFNAWFSNQWRCRITNLAKVHVNYQTLKCINILHIEIPKPMMSKFTCIIFFPWLYKIGCIRSMHSQYIHLSWIVLLTHSNK